MTKKIYWIKTLSSHYIYYAVEAETKPTVHDILEGISNAVIEEVTQNWRGEIIEGIEEVTPGEYLQHFDQVVEEPNRQWDKASKLSLITPIEEEDVFSETEEHIEDTVE